jgi:hypothetical protein
VDEARKKVAQVKSFKLRLEMSTGTMNESRWHEHIVKQLHNLTLLSSPHVPPPYLVISPEIFLSFKACCCLIPQWFTWTLLQPFDLSYTYASGNSGWQSSRLSASLPPNLVARYLLPSFSQYLISFLKMASPALSTQIVLAGGRWRELWIYFFFFCGINLRIILWD